MAKEYLDKDGVLYFWQKIKSLFVSDVAWDSTNKKLQKTKNGSTSDLVTFAAVATSGSYDDLSNKPTIPAGATVDSAMSSSSENPVQNKVIYTALGNKVDTTRKVNGHALSADVDVTNLDLGQCYGTCSTAASTAAKTVTMSNYLLTTGGIVTIKFTNAVPANATLNINSKGAKSIYSRGSAIAAGVIKAGDVATFIYDGTYYHLISVTNVVDAGFEAVSSGGSFTYYLYVTDSSGNKTQTYTASQISTYLSNKVNTSAVGVASGVCPLNSSSKIDSSYLPSYVDDVVEAYARTGQTALGSTWLATGSASGTVITPETGKIYILMEASGDYGAYTQFRYSGSAYVKMLDGGVSSVTNAEIDTIVAS